MGWTMTGRGDAQAAGAHGARAGHDPAPTASRHTTHTAGATATDGPLNEGQQNQQNHQTQQNQGQQNDGIYGGGVYPGVLPAVPVDGMPLIPDTDRRTNAATAAQAAGVRALSAQALQFYFRAPVKAFFRTRVDYLAYARDTGTGSLAHTGRLQTWLSRTTPGVLALAVRRHGWSVVPDQVLPPLLANVGVAAVLYTSYLSILGQLHPESAQAVRRVFPPPAPVETFAAGFLAGTIQSVVAAPLDAIQARYDHGDAGHGKRGTPQSMWAFSAAKLREIGLRGIFAGWSLSFAKDSIGNGLFFSVFEYVKAQGYYRYVVWYYGAMDDAAVCAQQSRTADAETDTRPNNAHNADDTRHTHDTPVLRPHYALEPAFLLLAGVSASFAQQVVLHPLTHVQVVHWDMLEDIDDAARAARAQTGPATASHARSTRFPVVQAYYRAYVQSWATCADLAAAEGRSRVSWLYRGFWWNAIRQVPSTSAGLIIFELLRRKYGTEGDGVRIQQDGYDILF